VKDCVVIRGGKPFAGRQGLSYFEGVSAESAGAQALCMHLLEMPPGAEAQPHLHQAHETAILVLSGSAKMRYGEDLSEELEAGAGDFLYIPPGVPHQPFNPRDEPCRAVIARTDPNEQESVVLLDAQGRRRP
jgi:uncharacterized RmlC-like cupin family protein